MQDTAIRKKTPKSGEDISAESGGGTLLRWMGTLRSLEYIIVVQEGQHHGAGRVGRAGGEKWIF